MIFLGLAFLIGAILWILLSRIQGNELVWITYFLFVIGVFVSYKVGYVDAIGAKHNLLREVEEFCFTLNDTLEVSDDSLVADVLKDMVEDNQVSNAEILRSTEFLRAKNAESLENRGPTERVGR